MKKMIKVSRASGFVTLTVTLMLTLAGSYLFFQSVDSAQYTVMRYQNTLSAKKNHWAAEGGLACAYGVNKTTAGTPMSRDYSLCNGLIFDGSADASRLQVAVTPIEITPGALYTLSSEAKEVLGRGKRVVMRDIALTGGGGSPMPGIFKTSSKLRLTGDFALTPNKNENNKGENECISIVVKNKADFLHTDSVTGIQLIVRDKDGYQQNQLPDGISAEAINTEARNDHLDFFCKAGYQTFQEVGKANLALAKDVLEDPNMDMFYDFFGVPKEQWKSVRDDKQRIDKIIQASTENGIIEDCAQQIAKAFADGNKKIWVEGSCYLKTPPAGEPQLPFNFSNPELPMTGKGAQALVVIQDGIVFSPANLGFSGLLYQFITDKKKAPPILANMPIACMLGGLCTSDHHAEPYKNRAFFINGALYTYGGIAVDMEGMEFNLNGSMVATYDKDKWDGLLPTPTGAGGGNVNWKEGTWRDF
ncbi:hypothetical protein VV869_10300 [Photobacterium sp. MCCC 1A19761]|uniref:hypothetical protein n=1 Tax=Photobacterium sp. MCCC 1A19761 TaxID=3115000 RepID=UPI00307D0632